MEFVKQKVVLHFINLALKKKQQMLKKFKTVINFKSNLENSFKLKILSTLTSKKKQN